MESRHSCLLYVIRNGNRADKSVYSPFCSISSQLLLPESCELRAKTSCPPLAFFALALQLQAMFRCCGEDFVALDDQDSAENQPSRQVLNDVRQQRQNHFRDDVHGDHIE